MDAADWEKYEKEGYSMDAYIGQSGFEEAFEEYLHGIDGQRVGRGFPRTAPSSSSSGA